MKLLLQLQLRFSCLKFSRQYRYNTLLHNHMQETIMNVYCMYFINLNRPDAVCWAYTSETREHLLCSKQQSARADTLMVMQFYCWTTGASRRRRWKSPAGRIVCVLPVCVCEREREKLRAAASEERWRRLRTSARNRNLILSAYFIKHSSGVL